ncbi:E3 ubiquitin-protein ligase arih1l [Diaporthe amygdali]|uniref:E3 ubiquitin-protein ligase arih1l n=1 Tax=Phomopsis amygdali TaxID=1214568 RepID=UPI0022FE4CB2|nr:E3 ubiquitin-protein ligase arih1l [Diaporthe amygdali]KAJ0108512.1 E3 ubiquitin-protein ligase arih1l [Diaporthe amygdali]
MERQQATLWSPRDNPASPLPSISQASSPPPLSHRRRLKQFQSIHQRLKEVESRHSFHRPQPAGHLAELKDILKKTTQKTRQAFQRKQEIISCTSYYDDFARKDLVNLSCQHSYCKRCFHLLILNALQTEANWPPRCCVNPIDQKTCLKNLSRAFSTRYKEKRQEYLVPIHERYYCPTPDCGLFVPPERINAPYRQAKCKNRHLTCMDCRQASHSDAVQCVRNQDMELVQVMALQEGWRRCYRCQTMIEHKMAGCRRIKCRCGAEFCYVCGAVWWTCGCSERQLKQIKKQAKLRRAQERERQYWYENGSVNAQASSSSV